MNAPLQLAESVADFSSAEHLVRVERLLVELVSESTASHPDPFDTGRAALAHLASGGQRVRAKLEAGELGTDLNRLADKMIDSLLSR